MDDFFKKNLGIFYKEARKRYKNEQDVEDLIQDAMLQMVNVKTENANNICFAVKFAFYRQVRKDKISKYQEEFVDNNKLCYEQDFKTERRDLVMAIQRNKGLSGRVKETFFNYLLNGEDFCRNDRQLRTANLDKLRLEGYF